MSRVSVNICTPGANFAPYWDDLVARASANVFLSPAALSAVATTHFAKVHLLLAWERDAGPQKLVGVWALREVQVARNGPAYLSTPPYEYSLVSNPVLDPEFAEDAVNAFFDAIERRGDIPNVIRLGYLDGECPTFGVIQNVLTARQAALLKISERQRPYISKTSDRKQSGSSKKKMRQKRDRLAKTGAVEILNRRDHDAAMDGFQTFLALEAASWKGKRGTALRCSKADLAFTGTLVSNLAREGNASVALLQAGGRTIAAQVLFYCGTLAYTWKTAFDENYADYSPGILLIDHLTETLLTTDGIEAIESCSPEGGFMSKMWDTTRPSVTLLVDIGRRKSLHFILLAAAERGYLQIKEFRNRMRARAR